MKISHIKTKIRTIYKGLINKSPCKKCLLRAMCSDLCPSKIYYNGVKLQYETIIQDVEMYICNTNIQILCVDCILYCTIAVLAVLALIDLFIIFVSVGIIIETTIL